MNLLNLFRRRPVDPVTMAILLTYAGMIRRLLIELETHLDAQGDRTGRRLVKLLHGTLEKMVRENGPALGADVVAFSGGGPKPEDK